MVSTAFSGGLFQTLKPNTFRLQKSENSDQNTYQKYCNNILNILQGTLTFDLHSCGFEWIKYV
jgi:hypothetical protein